MQFFKTQKRIKELEALCADQQNLIDKLARREIYTPIKIASAENPDEFESYMAALSQFFANPWVKSWFFKQERALIERFKSDPAKDNSDFYKGMLLLIESMRADLADISDKYAIRMAAKGRINAQV